MARFQNVYWKFGMRWITKMYKRGRERRFVTFVDAGNCTARIFTRSLGPIDRDYMLAIRDNRDVHVDYRNGHPPRTEWRKLEPTK